MKSRENRIGIVNCLAAAAVVDEFVGGVGTGAADDSKAGGLEAVANLAGGDVVKRDEVSTHAASVRSSHGGSGESASATAWCQGEDGASGSVDVNYIMG